MASASTAAPTPASMGPLDPCVKRVEYHKAVMYKTLVFVGMSSFFLGVCLCSLCICAVWCLSARLDFSVDTGGIRHSFDAEGVGQRFAQLHALLTGHAAPQVSEMELAQRRRRRRKAKYRAVRREEDDDSDGGDAAGGAPEGGAATV